MPKNSELTVYQAERMELQTRINERRLEFDEARDRLIGVQHIEDVADPFGDLDGAIAKCVEMMMNESETVAYCGITYDDLARWQSSRTPEQKQNLVDRRETLKAQVKAKLHKRMMSGETTFEQERWYAERLIPEFQPKALNTNIQTNFSLQELRKMHEEAKGKAVASS